MDSAALPSSSDQDLGDRLLEAEVGIGSDQANTTQTTAHQLPEKGSPELQVFGWTDVDTDDLALAAGLDSGRDQDCHRDHSSVFAHLLEGGVQHQVGVLGVESTIAECGYLPVELLADPADLVL